VVAVNGLCLLMPFFLSNFLSVRDITAYASDITLPFSSLSKIITGYIADKTGPVRQLILQPVRSRQQRCQRE
jgi:hypothetical protein